MTFVGVMEVRWLQCQLEFSSLGMWFVEACNREVLMSMFIGFMTVTESLLSGEDVCCLPATKLSNLECLLAWSL
jgi:hypothetical protein